MSRGSDMSLMFTGDTFIRRKTNFKVIHTIRKFIDITEMSTSLKIMDKIGAGPDLDISCSWDASCL